MQRPAAARCMKPIDRTALVGVSWEHAHVVHGSCRRSVRVSPYVVSR
jgi:hypothetical protein